MEIEEKPMDSIKTLDNHHIVQMSFIIFLSHGKHKQRQPVPFDDDWVLKNQYAFLGGESSAIK